MRNVEWVSLTDSQRGQLVGIWLLAADRDGEIPASEELIKKLCYMDETPNLQLFEKLGFIECCRQDDATVTSERCQHVVPETEAETETETEYDMKAKPLRVVPRRYQGGVSRVIGHIRQKKNLPFPRDGTKKLQKCEKVIADRLREGYTEEDLMAHADKLSGKVSAHRWFEKRHGKPPPINDRCWCPNVKWTPDEYFGPERFEKYFTKEAAYS